MGEVIELELNTTVDIPVEKILSGVIKHLSELDHVLVIGLDKNREPHYWMSTADVGINLVLLEKLKKELIDGAM